MAREAYKQIGPLACPAFNGELIYFNKQGWNHLIRKGRKFREPEEQEKRIRLIPQAMRIMHHAHFTQNYRMTRLGSSVSHFWEIRGRGMYESKSIIVHIILRRKNNGHLHFFSVF